VSAGAFGSAFDGATRVVKGAVCVAVDESVRVSIVPIGARGFVIFEGDFVADFGAVDDSVSAISVILDCTSACVNGAVGVAGDVACSVGADVG